MRSKTKEIGHGCVAEGRIATNCPQGGDAGHGGRTEFEIANTGGTILDVTLHDKEGNRVDFGNVKKVCIKVGGDWEADVLFRLLRWAAYELEIMIDQNAGWDL